MFSTIYIPTSESQPETKRRRNRNSRLICLGCRKRRIRCELPGGIDVPRSGELQEIQTPCYRCRRLGIPCVIRQTILGRPSAQSNTIMTGPLQRATAGSIESSLCMNAGMSPACGSTHSSNSGLLKDSSLDRDITYWNMGTLLLYKPQSSETLVVIHAIETLRCEHVEEEWFRHLPARYGHTHAMDLAVRALVQASAYVRGIAHLTPSDCFRALAPALSAVQADLTPPDGQSNDYMLAATALLAPFEGTIRRNGVPTRLHVEGLAAIMAARPSIHAVTQLARDIVDWYAAETSIIACIHGTPSPFERISRAYFASDGSHSDQAQLKALGNELFIHVPRLVILVRTLRLQPSLQHTLLLDTHTLLQSLLELQDPQVEMRLMQNVMNQQSDTPHTDVPLDQILHFVSIKDWEALTYYWQSRLSLLSLQRKFHELLRAYSDQPGGAAKPTSPLPSTFGPQTNEMDLLAEKILVSADFVPALPLYKQQHLLTHGMIMVWIASLTANSRVRLTSELLLRRASQALNAKPPLVAKDLDDAVEIFVGGECRGRFAEFYGM